MFNRRDLIAIGLGFGAGLGLGAPAQAARRDRAQGIPGTPRHAEMPDLRRIVPLDRPWSFRRESVPAAADPAFDDTAWPQVSLPHTWNGRDGEDGGEYYRGEGWYRIRFDHRESAERVWLEFDGAALTADAWVNGVHVGRHEGGYARFRFDVTEAVRGGENLLCVRVDNSAAEHIAPLGGDFTVFGGLYRPVRLVLTDPVHIALDDFGGPGVYATTRGASADRAELDIVARLSNDAGQPHDLRVRLALIDADGAVAARLDRPVALAPGAREEVRARMEVPAPRLWQGRRDPHLYQLAAELVDADGAVRDRVTVQTGIRSTAFDARQGFFLNGRSYPLNGVNYQLSTRPGRGTAVQDFEILEDFEIMDEMAVTAIRFAHMQHALPAYELADALGLAVWTEVPLVAAAAASQEFSDTLARQMRELVRQTMNHPSVIVWGVGNEVYAADDAAVAAVARAREVAREEDPSRATVYAHCCQDDLHRIATQADLGAYNRYYGWYDGEMEDIGSWADTLHARAPDRAFAVSEYGAGASILQQQSPPDRPRPDGGWHPEQYQTAFHETYWRALRSRDFVWGRFVWVAFDFPSDGRNEGDRAGINDKGLVTHDRAVRKDAWYWYKANWSAEPVAHILERRRTRREGPATSLRAYGNEAQMTLHVNGRRHGTAHVVDHVAEWTDVPLAPGVNRIDVESPGGAGDSVWLWRV